MFENAQWITEAKSVQKAEDAASHSEKLSTGEVVASVHNPRGRYDPAPVFRKAFTCRKGIKKAEIAASACGLYCLYVNGTEVNCGLFNPGWTDYQMRTQYQVYDVTHLLNSENTLEILGGGGWALAGLLGAGEHFFSDRICAILQLDIQYEDGTSEVTGTDDTWEVWHSYLLFSHPYQGEVIDYAKMPEYAGKAVCTAVETALVPQEREPVLPHERLKAQRLLTTPAGEKVIDFGQNLAGYTEVRIFGHMGDRVVIRHAETLDENGNFYTKNLRTAAQKMEYTLGSDGLNVLKPIFTFQGFRYIAVETYPETDITADDFTAVSVYTDMKRTGFIRSGNEKVSKLCECILWNMRSNFLEVPTDCPQRDERLGWLGDAQVFCKSAGFYYDVYNFYFSWLKDIVSGQREDGGIPSIAPYNRKAKPFRVSAAWADAITIIPMTLYELYGDRTALEYCYPAMCRYIEYLRNAGPEEYLWLSGNHYGDWLALDGPDPRQPKTDKDMLATAYYFRSADLCARAARILSKPAAEIRKLEALRDNVRSEFRKRFLNVQDTYAACSVLLTFGLLENDERPAVAKHLAEMVSASGNRLLAGVVGAPLVLHALSDNGYAEKAYDMLLEESVPSWLGMLRFGATTLWERLDTFSDSGMKDIRNASLNHYMFGAMLDWITGDALGIKPLEPGYKKFAWKPLPEKRLGMLSMALDTRNGQIKASWEITGEKIRYELQVPPGTSAEIVLPGEGVIIAPEGRFSIDR